MGEIAPRSIAVVGLGLIGTSVALAAQARWPGIALIGLDRRDALDNIHGADVVVLAAPVDAIIEMLPEVARRVTGETLVLDTGSTKRAILAAAGRAGLPQFVGGHPMAGGTQPGPSGARADLFKGRTWFLVAGAASSAALERATTFVEGLGARPNAFQDAGERHDGLVAAVSHLPQVVASSLMTVVADAVGAEGLQWAGAGLRDTTRLALSHADIWTSILATNQEQIKPLLKQLAARLDAIADRLDDREAVSLLFDEAVRAKASCL